jgi:hypothetical protein
MRKPFPLRRSALCVAACFVVHAVSAATINTSAKDSSGKLLTGVVVVLQDASGKQVAQQTTDNNGVARFTGIPSGRGVGVGAPQYGGRRTWYAGLAQRF